MIKAEITGQTNGFFKVDNDKKIPNHSITDIILTFFCQYLVIHQVHLFYVNLHLLP